MSHISNRSVRSDDSTDSHPHRRLESQPGMPARGVAVSAALLVVLAAVTLFSVGAAGAQGEGSPVDDQITSVQFDLEPVSVPDDDPLSANGSEFEARYRTVVVADAGTEVRLGPLAGPVSVTLSGNDAQAMTAELNGMRIGPNTAEFGDALADALSSNSVHRFARIGGDEAGQPVSVDVFYGRPLTAGGAGEDRLLVQEVGGDGGIELIAIDATGTPIGQVVSLGPGSAEPSYQWNTGHGPAGESPSWVSAVGIGRFKTDRPVDGIRITAAGAEVKVVALTSIGAPVLSVPQTESPTPSPAPGDGQPSNDPGVKPVVSPAAVAADETPPELVEVAVPPTVASATADTAPATEDTVASATADTGPATEDTSQVTVAPATEDTTQDTVAAAADPAEAPVAPKAAGRSDAAVITQLAMTGPPTEPWVLVVIAMGLIFIGYTVYAAYRRQNIEGEPCGHDQLDSLGFD